MDWLLYFYILVLSCLLCAPFLFYFFRYTDGSSPFGKEEDPELRKNTAEKKNLLDALKDYRSDLASGKISERDFQEASLPLLAELENLEKQISSSSTTHPS